MWRSELGLFAAAYAIYNGARWVLAGDMDDAREHADWILGLERSAGVAVEAAVQDAFSAGLAAWLLSHLYLAAQLVVVPAALVWLYRRAPRVYRELRNTILATWLLAVPVFALFPVAPPRLAGVGLADTVGGHAAVELTGRSTIFFNPIAAVPSLHVGFAVAVGVAVAAALERRSAKALALLWGPAVALSVVATGNHYLFDIVAGLAVTAVGFAVGRGAANPMRGRWLAVLGRRRSRRILVA
jgi:membrane-associated phospholipid phosphatase